MMTDAMTDEKSVIQSVTPMCDEVVQMTQPATPNETVLQTRNLRGKSQKGNDLRRET
jgi:hypothetical protein